MAKRKEDLYVDVNPEEIESDEPVEEADDWDLNRSVPKPPERKPPKPKQPDWKVVHRAVQTEPVIRNVETGETLGIYDALVKILNRLG